MKAILLVTTLLVGSLASELGHAAAKGKLIGCSYHLPIECDLLIKIIVHFLAFSNPFHVLASKEDPLFCYFLSQTVI